MFAAGIPKPIVKTKKLANTGSEHQSTEDDRSSTSSPSAGRVDGPLATLQMLDEKHQLAKSSIDALRKQLHL